MGVWPLARLTCCLVVLGAACRTPPPVLTPPAPQNDATDPNALPFASVAVMPIHAKGQADPAVLEVLDDLLLSSLQNLAGERLRVVGKSDIDAMLGFEKTKDATGCDDVTCATEIAGALGVDSLISPTAGTLGGRYLLTLVWIDQQRARVYRRHSEPLGTATRTFDAGVNKAAAILLGINPPEEIVQPASPEPAGLSDLQFEKIKDERTGLCLSVDEGARDDQPLKVRACADAKSRFAFLPFEAGLRLQERTSGKCVAVKASALPGDYALAASCVKNDNHWDLVDTVNDGQPVKLLRDGRTGLCLEVANDARSGDAVRVWDCAATDTLFQLH